jgi:methylated-DNA-[protein]-cysteine S-methyltransferase
MRAHRLLATPTGPMALLEHADGPELRWIGGPHDPLLSGSTERPDLRPGLVARLQRYFAGEAVDFGDVPLPAGGPFFRRCWAACRTIPRGETRSYRALAAMAGSGPGAARAAGQAMRRNRLPIVIPCHRVIAADGSLHGFAGSRAKDGLELSRKQALLALERDGRPSGVPAALSLWSA